MVGAGRVNVVHVAGQLDMGGMEKLLVEFARHANRERFALHFLTLGRRGILADEIEALGWPVMPLEVGPGLRPRLLLRLAGWFRRLKADVVHTHNTRPLMYAGPAARLARVRRVIHTRHGQRFGATRRQTVGFRLASLAADRVVCVSRDSARIAAAEGISERRIRTLWNGIDLGRFPKTASACDGPVLAVGRLSPEKDFPTLIRAAAIAARAEPSFRLEIAGDGACFADMRQLVDKLNLGDVVRLLGQVRDVPALLARGGIFTLASLTEGVSLTILEAMATGLPVVATRVGGNPEVVAEGETGLLVPPGDPAVLAAALLELWRNPERRVAMGRAGRQRVEECFEIRKMLAAYEELYLEDNLEWRTGRPGGNAAVLGGVR
jgi:glycosyltransferase involved in cell wall biosynthesis